MARSLAPPETLAALRTARDSVNQAIKAARLGHGIRYDTYIAVSTLRQLKDELETAA
jgi:hypothetical protein